MKSFKSEIQNSTKKMHMYWEGAQIYFLIEEHQQKEMLKKEKTKGC